MRRATKSLSAAKIKLIVSGAIFAVGFVLFAQTWLYTHQTRVVSGTVVQMVELQFEDELTAGENISRPRVVFQAEDGQTYSFIANQLPPWPRYKVNDTVAIRYAIADPAAATLEDAITLWFPPALAIGTGLLYLAVAFGLGLLFRTVGWIIRGGQQRHPAMAAPDRPATPSPAWIARNMQRAAISASGAAAAALPTANPWLQDARAAGAAAAAYVPPRPPFWRRLWRRMTAGYATLPQRLYFYPALMFSGAVFFIGLISLLYACHFYSTAASAQGIVIERVESRTSFNGVDRFLIANRIVFADFLGREARWQNVVNNPQPAAGRTVEWLSAAGKEPRFAPGETVPMLYDARNPRMARIDSLEDIFGDSLAILGVGTVMFLVLLPRFVFGLFGARSGIVGTLIVTVVLIAAGAGIIAYQSGQKSDHQSVMGKVIENVAVNLTDELGRAYIAYRARVAFEAEDGSRHDILYIDAYRTPEYADGDSIRVQYPKNNPGAAYFYFGTNSWLIGSVVIGVALLNLLIRSAFALVLHLMTQRQRDERGVFFR